MAAYTKLPLPSKGNVGRRGVVHFWHTVTIGGSGAISSQDTDGTGIVAVKTASETGRYTLTIGSTGSGVGSAYKKLLCADVMLIGPDDAVFGANTVGIHWFFRDNDVDGGAKDGTIELQFATRGGTNIDDAEVPSGTVFKVHIAVDAGP